MGDFFNTRRRRIGVVTMFVSCTFAGLAMIPDNFGISVPVGKAFYRGTVTPEGIMFTHIKLIPSPGETVLAVIPYSPLCFPLSLLSAFLLLTNPRVARPKIVIANRDAD